MMKYDSFRKLSAFERGLLAISLLGVGVSYLISPAPDLLSLVASLIGVTALIFVAKGYVLGQVLTVVFALLYGIVSFRLRYYGEVMTYLGMTSPMAVFSIVSWLRHPYQNSGEVAVARLSRRAKLLLPLTAAAVTTAFYFILAALDTANLPVSTISVTTSYFASALTFLRSPCYALAYAANDLVLILLWATAAFSDPAYLPMVLCFSMFLLNDIYGFINWRRMARRQQEKLSDDGEHVNKK